MVKQPKCMIEPNQLLVNQQDPVINNDQSQQNNQQQQQKQKKKCQKMDSRECRMMWMVIIHLLYMFAELITGIVANSLTLTGDAFHMLSDTFAMIVGWVSIRLGKREANAQQTFGYKRLEILGAFFNASFLLSTAFFLITEIVHKFIEPEIPGNIEVVLGVSIGGIVINIIGMILTGHDGHHHGHSHGHGHGHDHHHHDHDHEHEHEDSHDHDHEHEHSHEHEHEHDEHHEHHDHDEHEHEHEHHNETLEVAQEKPVNEKDKKKDKKEKKQKKKKSGDMAFRGVFLHVLGDFMGSVIAIAAALVVMFAGDSPFAPYADPIGSCLMIIILVRASVPLLMDSMQILMLTSNVDTDKVQKDIEQLENVKVHDLHIWQYLPDQPVAHCHVEVLHCDDQITLQDYDKKITDIQKILHGYGIHKTAVEVELLNKNEPSLSQCFQRRCKEQKQWQQ